MVGLGRAFNVNRLASPAPEAQGHLSGGHGDAFGDKQLEKLALGGRHADSLHLLDGSVQACLDVWRDADREACGVSHAQVGSLRERRMRACDGLKPAKSRESILDGNYPHGLG